MCRVAKFSPTPERSIKKKVLKMLFGAGYVTIVVGGTLKSVFSFFIGAAVHELQLVQEFSCTPNPAVQYNVIIVRVRKLLPQTAPKK